MVQCDITSAVTMATHFIGTYRTNAFNKTVCKEPNVHTHTIGSNNKNMHTSYITAQNEHVPNTIGAHHLCC